MFKTKLTGEQVCAKLAENIEAEKRINLKSFLGINPYSKPYTGVIRGNTFKLNRVKNDNPILINIPSIVSGYICEDHIWTRIHVEIKLTKAFKIFNALWFSLVGFGCILEIFLLTTSDEYTRSAFSLIPFVMLLMGLFVFLIWPFKAKSVKIKSEFMKLFEAEIDE